MSQSSAVFDRSEPLPEEQTDVAFSSHTVVTEQDLAGTDRQC